MNIAQILEVENTLRDYKELQSKVSDMYDEDDTQTGMIRIGEHVCNFLGIATPLKGFYVTERRNGVVIDAELDRAENKAVYLEMKNQDGEGIE